MRERRRSQLIQTSYALVARFARPGAPLILTTVPFLPQLGPVSWRPPFAGVSGRPAIARSAAAIASPLAWPMLDASTRDGVTP